MVDEGYVNKNEHPDGGLFIYNYSPKTQYEPNWNKSTMLARGLILDANGAIVARPFPKFFTLEQHSSSDLIFHKPFTVFDKMDGSLGICYRNPSGNLAIATRGSFVSDQALWATEHIRTKYAEWVEHQEYFWKVEGVDSTYLFEIIYPQNRIVVNYGWADLILLALVRNSNGRDFLNWEKADRTFIPFPVVKHYDAVDCKPSEVIAHLNPVDDGDTEGYVLRFDWPPEGPQTRIKVKLEEYCRLHRILTQVSSKSIWECLKAGDLEMKDLMDRVPDEFYQWVRDTSGALWRAHEKIYDAIYCEYSDVLDQIGAEDNTLRDRWTYMDIKNNSSRRKRFAELAQEKEHTGLIFMMLDQNWEKAKAKVWDMVKPKFEKAFAKDIDELV